jgi:hypothetical protein
MAEVAPDDLRHCERSEAIHGHKQGWIGRFAPRNDGCDYTDTA